ncbi:MAG: hydantoinase/oxoprolinase family protein, partial [Firmicutes bacterium]|nr:hydantoinase/oxoprolinase family protein [Bacillota bacterium]
MRLALGIDTGGTYTDGVVLDLVTRRVVAKAKALTTRHNLALGIGDCISRLKGINPADIKLVSLSTTLATNAVVEGLGGEVGAILIGREPSSPLPSRHVEVVRGRFDTGGGEREPLDLDAVQRAVVAMEDKVDAFAVSGYLSIRNPAHEL